MNRAQRRAWIREDRHQKRRPKVVPLCPPGHHRFGELIGTVQGEQAASAVVCQRCRRTFGQIMHESPADLALFRGWLRTELLEAADDHVEACPRRFSVDYPASDNCSGCARQDAATRLAMGVGL